MTNSIRASQLKTIISNHYDLGKLVDYEQLFLGYCNISYIIMIERSGKRKRFFLRRYRQGTTEEEIAFEHSVINHLIKKNFHLVAGIIPTRDGKTCVQRSESGENVFYAVFEFLTGDDRYTWVDPNCSDEDLKGAAVVLARFHNAVSDLIPKGRKHEAKIIDLLPETAHMVDRCAQQAGKTVFDAYFLENIHLIQRTIQHARHITEDEEYKGLPQLVIHCDFHPGNLKFQKENITGLFDFDWSKVDVRCFDAGLAMFYFCISWEGEQDGVVHLNKVALFLETYQNELQGTPGIGPLSDVELKYLPYLISAGNIYVVNWTIRDFYSAEVDPHEYLTYLQHHVRFMKWLESKDNWGKLENTINV
jgi:homoserine kinase type II